MCTCTWGEQLCMTSVQIKTIFFFQILHVKYSFITILFLVSYPRDSRVRFYCVSNCVCLLAPSYKWRGVVSVLVWFTQLHKPVSLCSVYADTSQWSVYFGTYSVTYSLRHVNMYLGRSPCCVSAPQFSKRCVLVLRNVCISSPQQHLMRRKMRIHISIPRTQSVKL
jgi:hypothetical protein